MAIQLMSFSKTGLSWLDSQNDDLFKKIEKFFNGMSNGKGREEVPLLIDALIKYSSDSLKKEENEMKAKNYELYESHLNEHNEFRQNVRNFRTRVNENGIDTRVALDMQRLATRWIREHCTRSDKNLAEFIQESNKRAV